MTEKWGVCVLGVYNADLIFRADRQPLLGETPALLALPNVTATPHIGFVERGNYEKYFGDAFDAVNAFAAGEPVRVVDSKR